MRKRFTREEFGWIMYDWANSAYAAIIAAIILPIFFYNVADKAGVPEGMATSYWGYATSFATLVCALCAPILGGLGDYPGNKKRLFTLFVIIGAIGSGLLFFTSNWVLVLVFYIISTIGFYISNIFYDSFLNDVTTPERMDLVSTYGYGLGYIGGSTIPLVIGLLLYIFHDNIGMTEERAMQYSFLLTAVWWLVFTIPMWRHVKQKHSITRQAGLARQTFSRLKDTFLEIVGHKEVLFFIIAYFFYIDGVGTIIHMATVFGKSVGLQDMHMMLVLLVVQIVAFPFAILYGYIAKRIGTRNTILIRIGTYVLVCIIALGLSNLAGFLVLGALVGTAQGGIQALSRSFFGKLIPADRSGEFFGFFDIFGKFSAVIGPFLFGLLIQLTGVQHTGIIPVLAMFIVGGLLMWFAVPNDAKRFEES